MGNLDHSTDVRATKLEASVRWMIEADILAALNPVRASIHDFDARFPTCERRVDTIVYELDADTNEKQIEVKEDNIDGDLPNLEETILQ
ncbi:hypothetical protein EJD97_000282 [Solanum chilense]|uniref:Uncharacterized protein n=1 Tax=Solanum chilense TaxID=4083 RepID=A0A6N2BZK1_SOLCI|nr:hypothetical protein EJD97_000282 [Solanum chilense]